MTFRAMRKFPHKNTFFQHFFEKIKTSATIWQTFVVSLQCKSQKPTIMADIERGPGLMSKYVWLIETIYRAKRISLKGINELWRENEDLSRGEDLPARTFNNWRYAIQDIFGLIIDNEKCGAYRYYIYNEDDITDNGLCSWMFSTFCVSNALSASQSIKDRIILENVPSGQLYLQSIVEAMKEGRELKITYYSFWNEEDYTFTVQPYCLKLFKQRWYMLGKSQISAEPRIYALDRIRQLVPTDNRFTMPTDWSAEEYFDGFFGIIADRSIEKELVKLKVTKDQAKYIRTLPMHSSQEETERNDEYSIFTYFLRPTYDFIHELLWNADTLEVLEPQWLRDDMAQNIRNMLKRYEK